MPGPTDFYRFFWLSCCFRGLLSGASAGAPRPLLTFPDVDLVT